MVSLPVCPIDLNQNLIGGIDEVGYGCFAGPVVSALVILPKDFQSEFITDSKALKKEEQRRFAYEIIMDAAIDYACEAVSVKTINKVGIVQANMMSMEKCIRNIKTKPEYLLIDGNKWSGYNDIPYETVVKGDATYLSIAAASIVAKVRRDDYMIKLSEQFPGYGWESNKGYGTKVHSAALKTLGPNEYHRTQYIRKHI